MEYRNTTLWLKATTALNWNENQSEWQKLLAYHVSFRLSSCNFYMSSTASSLNRKKIECFRAVLKGHTVKTIKRLSSCFTFTLQRSCLMWSRSSWNVHTIMLQYFSMKVTRKVLSLLAARFCAFSKIISMKTVFVSAIKATNELSPLVEIRTSPGSFDSAVLFSCKEIQQFFWARSKVGRNPSRPFLYTEVLKQLHFENARTFPTLFFFLSDDVDKNSLDCR